MNLTPRLNTLYHEGIGKHLFLSSFIILWVYYILLYPTLSYQSEVYAEHGYIYLYHAYNSTFAQNIWGNDAGYLVWLPRFIGLLVSVVASPYYYIYVTNFIALALVAFFVSFINHTGFRSILPNDTLRFALSLIFGMIILPTYEIFTFINFSYTGFIFIAFLLFLDKEKLPCVQYIAYAILCALLCISKFHLVGFFPLFLVAIVLHLYRKEQRSAWFYLPAILTIFIQISYVILVSSHEPGFVRDFSNYHSNPLYTLLKSLRGVAFWSTSYATQFRFLGHAIIAQLAGLTLAGFLLFTLIKAWKSKEMSPRVALLILTFNIISVVFGMMTSLSQGSGIVEAALENAPYPFGRRFFISYIMVWLSTCILLLNIKQLYIPFVKKYSVAARNGLLGVFLLLSVCITVPKIYTKERTRVGNPDSLSDWSRFYPLFKNSIYYIPVDAAKWGLIAGIRQGTDLYRIYESDHKGMSEGVLLMGRLPSEIYSVIIKEPLKTELYAIAYNEKDQPVGRATLISHEDTVNKYLIFEQPVAATNIRFFNGLDQPITDIGRVAVYILNEEK